MTARTPQYHIRRARSTARVVRDTILRWYRRNGRRGLPWRATTSVYRVAIAEMMLQQTNVPKVLDKYEAFLAAFPTVHSLAAAPQATVMRQWRGLGYNRRAINVHKMAQRVVRDHGGRFPLDPAQLAQLPGIGPYTSRSIPIFARNVDCITQDVNITRLVCRWHASPNLDNVIVERLLAIYLPRGRARDWHNALMDFGSLVCTKRAPQCVTCPLARRCMSYPSPADPQRRARQEVGRSECGKHVPRRIYRGRIVEFLRTRVATRDAIGAAIKKDWCVEVDGAWCDDVLRTLARDGMIAQTGTKWHLR